MTKEQEVLTMAKRLRELWPGVTKITLDVCEGTTELDFYRLPDYEAGTTLLRDLNIGKRDKSPYDADREPWHILRGTAPEGLYVVAFCGGLPPSCHIEEYTERVPVSETVVKNNEFIEVKRKKIVCG